MRISDCSSHVSASDPSVDDAYYDASGLRQDFLAAVGLKAPLGDSANFAIKPYYHNNHGRGLWATPYVARPHRSEERRLGERVSGRVDPGGRRIMTNECKNKPPH